MFLRLDFRRLCGLLPENAVGLIDEITYAQREPYGVR
jgi:hypothetical protein